MSAVVKTCLTWQPAGKGQCPCGQDGDLFHALEQTDKTQKPRCMRCVDGIERTVRARRERKDLNPDATKRR
jgi:hypothetical protein